MTKFILAAVAAAFLLSACAGTPETRATNALAITCDTYSVLLDQLTPHKADMSISTVERVNAANSLVEPACASDSTIDPAEAVGTVRSGLTLLRTVKEAF